MAQLIPKSDTFTLAFVQMMLGCEMDDNDQPLHRSFTTEDLSPDALAEIMEDCAAFQAAHADEIGDSLERAGYDFYLTRNRHGSGFWDGDWPEPAATILTNDSHVYGTLGLYVGDDGKLYTHN